MEAPVRIENGLKARGGNRRKKICEEVAVSNAMNCVTIDKEGPSAQLQESVKTERVLGGPSEVGLSLDFRKPIDDTQASTSKSERLRECVDQHVSNESKKKVSGILTDVQQLSDIEKLLLYLQLPTGAPPSVDPLKQKSPGNPLGKKADIEVAQTYTWIQSHLEEDSDVSLPKQEVYEEYRLFCQANKIEALCAADFGKVMKFVFPSVKPRRLGTRGNSRYCYSGLRKRLTVDSPGLPDLTEVPEALQEKVLGGRTSSSINSGVGVDDASMASCYLIFEWAEKLLGKRFTDLQDLAYHLLENTYVDTRSVAAFTLLSSLSLSPNSASSTQNGQVNTNKGNQGNAIFKNTGNTSRRRETQLQLQRKLLEKELIKEQKKKMQEQRNQVSKSCKGSRKNSRKEGSQQGNNKTKDESLGETTSNSFSGSLVKLEDMDENKDAEVIFSGPQKLLRCKSENGIPFELERKVKKVPIMRKSSSPAVCFPQAALSSIIILPTLPQQVQIAPSDMGSRSPTKVVAQQKYKRIQPKPAAGTVGKAFGTICSPVHNNETFMAETTTTAAFINRSFTESPQSFTKTFPQAIELPLLSETINNGIDLPTQAGCTAIQLKNESSLLEAGLGRIDTKQLVEMATPCDSTKVAGVIVETQTLLHSKRQAEDPETRGVAKKLHLEDTSGDLTIPSPTNKNEPLWTEMEPTSELPEMSKIGEAIGMPANISCRPEEKSDMSIRDLESDALMEFLQGGTPSNLSLVSTDTKAKPRAFKQVAKSSTQLSQLRLLLERNLPHHAVNRLIGNLKQPSGMEPSASSTVDLYINEFSELKQALLRDNRKSFRSKSEPSSERVLQSWFTDTSLTAAINDKNLALEKSALEALSSTNAPQIGSSSIMEGSLLSEVNISSPCMAQPASELSQGPFPCNDLLQQRPVESILCSSICTQVPSVPPSPNTRRRAFNFMPISPRQTPNPSDSHANNMSPVPPQFVSGNHMMPSTSNAVASVVSIAVGPSQPPSAASSPFVSPRSTPVPVVRSRHNSGQSVHRQTPCQTTDSGVSSISTSPFVSPQTTPIPVSRLRHNSNHSGSLGKTVTFSTNGPQVSIPANSSFQCRSRHSSGPLTMSTAVGQGFLSQPPMSPLVGENYTQTSFSETPSSQRSRHNSASSQPPVSPISNPFSPLALVSSDPMVGSDTGSVFSLKQSPNVQWSSGSWSSTRNRHVSGSVIHHKPAHPSSLMHTNTDNPSQGQLRDSALSQEIQSFLKAPPMALDSSTRSRSVPLHQMLRNMIDQCANSQDEALGGPENIFAVSRSYPATPLNDTPFHLPIMGVRDPLEDQGLSSLKGQQSDWNSLEILAPSSRRNLSDLLENPPMEDDLQTTLEDLRDCDNDYSKFALELDQVSQEDNFS